MDDFQGNSGRNGRHGDRAQLENLWVLWVFKGPNRPFHGGYCESMRKTHSQDNQVPWRNRESLKVLFACLTIFIYRC